MRGGSPAAGWRSWWSRWRRGGGVGCGCDAPPRGAGWRCGLAALATSSRGRHIGVVARRAGVEPDVGGQRPRVARLEQTGDDDQHQRARAQAPGQPADVPPADPSAVHRRPTSPPRCRMPPAIVIRRLGYRLPRIRTRADARPGDAGRAPRLDRAERPWADRVERRPQVREGLGPAQARLRDQPAHRGRLPLLPLRGPGSGPRRPRPQPEDHRRRDALPDLQGRPALARDRAAAAGLARELGRLRTRPRRPTRPRPRSRRLGRSRLRRARADARPGPGGEHRPAPAAAPAPAAPAEAPAPAAPPAEAPPAAAPPAPAAPPEAPPAPAEAAPAAPPAEAPPAPAAPAAEPTEPPAAPDPQQ